MCSRQFARMESGRESSWKRERGIIKIVKLCLLSERYQKMNRKANFFFCVSFRSILCVLSKTTTQKLAGIEGEKRIHDYFSQSTFDYSI